MASKTLRPLAGAMQGIWADTRAGAWRDEREGRTPAATASRLWLALACAGGLGGLAPVLAVAAEPAAPAAAASAAAAPAPAASASAPAAAASGAASAGASAAPQAAQVQQLPLLRTKAAPLEDHGGVTRTDETTLKRFPAPNGDITSVLKLNTAVQFDNSQLSSLTLGEIAPANISINGAKYYQNLFLLDGLSLNNDLDPAASNPRDVNSVPSTTQGMPVDKDMVCNVEVHDSNVSARYGAFQGGVVKAELCEAQRAFSGRVTYSRSRSAWTKIFVDPTQAQAMEDATTEVYQKEWDKESWRASLQFRPTETLGVVTYITHSRSTIPLKGYAASFKPETDAKVKDQTRSKTDALVKLDWRPMAGQHGWLTLRHEPIEDRYFNQNGRLTTIDIQGGGNAVTGGWAHEWAGQRLRHDVSWSHMRSSRRGDVDYFKYWYWSEDKNWGDKTRNASQEGAWGDVDTTQRSVSYSLESRLIDGGDFLGARHDFSWGLSLSKREASYERLKDHPVYAASARALTNNCTDANGVVDTEACSLVRTTFNPAFGQYFKSRDIYLAGRFDVSAAQGSLWLEDQLTWDRFSLRGGLRLERDQLAGQPTLAPRLAATYKVTADGDTQMHLGLNRYYGRSFFNAAINEKRDTLKIDQTRGTDLIWKDGTRAKPTNRLDEIDVPYDDEATLGVSQRLFGVTASARWVHRESRDGLTRKRERDASGTYSGTGPYVYTNEGRGSSDTVSLNFSGDKPLVLAGTRHNWSLGLNRSLVRTNFVDYETQLDLVDPDKMIQYRGQFIRMSDRPADNYNRPWTGRLSISSDFPGADISLYQFARWQGGYRRIVNTGKTVPYNGGTAAVWDEVDLPASWSWDLGLTWQPRWGRHRPFVTLNVENVTNRKNIIVGTTSGVMTYERGRSFSLQAGYEF